MNPANPAADQDYSAGYERFVLLMLTLVYTPKFIDRQLPVILPEPINAEMRLSDARLSLLSGCAFTVIYVSAGIPTACWADALSRDELQ